jgi:tetratricopeptide (TPR) repeat protein
LPGELLAAPDRRFVGRVHELDEIERRWQVAASGTGQVVLLSGEPGIGKTYLASEAARRLHARGGLVLLGHCDEFVGPAYQPFREAIGRFARSCTPEELNARIGSRTSDLVRLVPDLRDLLGGDPPPAWGEPATERFEMFDAASQLLTSIARDCAMVLVVEDLQWVGDGSRLLLRHIVQQIAETPILVIGTYRTTGPATPFSTSLAELSTRDEVTTLRLGGLEDRDIAELLTAHVTGPNRGGLERLATAVRTQTAGNPLLVTAIVEEIATQSDGPTLGQDTRMAGGIRAIVERRLASLSPAAREVLAVAAVAGTATTISTLRQIIDQPSGAPLVDAIDELLREGVLVQPARSAGSLVFAHELIRTQVAGSLPHARVIDLHRSIGDALERLGDRSDGRLDELAFHFAEAAQDGDASKAVEYGIQSARRAMRQLAYSEAVATLDRASAVARAGYLEDPLAFADLFLSLAEARFGAQDLAGFKEAVFAAADVGRQHGSPAHLGRAAALIGRWGPFLARPDPETNLLCEEALGALGDTEPRLRAEVLSALARRHALADGDGLRAEPLAIEAIDLARAADSPDALAQTLFAYGTILQGSPRVDEQLSIGEEVAALGRVANDALTTTNAALLRVRAHLERGDIEAMRACIAELDDLGAHERSWLARANAAMYRGVLALIEGRWPDAEDQATEMLRHTGDDPSYLSVFAGQLFFAGRERGNIESLRQPLADAIAENDHLVVFKAGLALLDAELGLLDTAREGLEALARNSFGAIPHDMTRPAALAILVETTARLDDRPRAEQLIPLLQPYADLAIVVATTATVAGSCQRFLGIANATIGHAEASIEHFERALAFERAMNAPPLVARSLVEYAEMLIAQGKPEPTARGRALASECHDIADRHGMTALVNRSQAML